MVNAISSSVFLAAVAPDYEPLAGSSHRSGSSGPSRREPAPHERQREFETLMNQAGIHRGRVERQLYRCPFHGERDPSLNVDWIAAIFHCHGAGCQASGGLRRLRELLGIPSPRGIRTPNTSIRQIDVEQVHHRISDGLWNILPPGKAQEVANCGQSFQPYRCANGHGWVRPIVCRQQVCPSCSSWTLRNDWQAKIAEAPDRLMLLRLRANAALSGREALKDLRGRFRHWRDSRRLSGLYGARFEPGLRPVLLLMLREGDLPDTGKGFSVEEAGRAVTPDEALAWLQGEYLEELAHAWRDEGELAILEATIRGRRRFQGFGEAFKGPEVSTCSVEDTHQEGSPSVLATNLRKTPPSGGSGHAKKPDKACPCPVCGAQSQPHGLPVGLADVERDPRGYFRLRELKVA